LQLTNERTNNSHTNLWRGTTPVYTTELYIERTKGANIDDSNWQTSTLSSTHRFLSRRQQISCHRSDNQSIN